MAAPEIHPHIGRGALAVDLNADHIAVTETDRFGNYQGSFILPFDLDGLSTHQTKAILGDISALLTATAEKAGKPLVIEELDFEEKKKALRELPKERRRFLSAFAYAHFHRAVSSRARSRGIGLTPINPAYTSLIGAYKYQGLSISSHEKAALAIARRAQGYSEGLKVFQGTLSPRLPFGFCFAKAPRPSQAMMTERLQFEGGTRHVWGFYSDHRQKIRRLLIEHDKRPLLPIATALSRAKAYPSLYQSLWVTRKQRGIEAQRCASG